MPLTRRIKKQFLRLRLRRSHLLLHKGGIGARRISMRRTRRGDCKIARRPPPHRNRNTAPVGALTERPPAKRYSIRAAATTKSPHLSKEGGAKRREISPCRPPLAAELLHKDSVLPYGAIWGSLPTRTAHHPYASCQIRSAAPRVGHDAHIVPPAQRYLHPLTAATKGKPSDGCRRAFGFSVEPLIR